MNESSKTYWTDDPDMVERYVLGRLTDEERLRLDAEIAGCEPCKEKLRRELETAAGIRRHGRDAMKIRLRRSLRKDRTFPLQRYQIAALVAAVIIIALGVGLYKIWFADLVAPKKFQKKEIIFQQQEVQKSEQRDETPAVAELQQAESEESRPDRTKDETIAGGKKKMDRVSPAAPSSSAGRAALSKTAPEPKKNIASKELTVAKSIWLLGTVVMTPDAKSDQIGIGDRPSAMMAEQNASGAMRRDADKKNTIRLGKGNLTEEITLQQRSFNALPRARQTQFGKKNRVETLLESNDQGLQLTIFSDEVSSADIGRATIESTSPDSLIITTPTQRIYYRIPAEMLRSGANPGRR